jgi:hypothetical protein
MLRCLFLFSFSLILFLNAAAQSLYQPRDVQQAFKKGTRAADGKPGKNYWQNTARYNIVVNATPPNRNIEGQEDITYFNNSPDTLKSIVIKLLLNIHKPGAQRGFAVSEDYLTPGVIVDEFTINGIPQFWKGEDTYFTWRELRLPKKLSPHDSVQLSFKWHYELSKLSNREGMIDSTTFFLAYFYPRVAVYDDCDGWDKMEFTDIQEFYSDFNDYTVTVNVPKDYVVWGTGTLQRPETILQPAIAQRLHSSFTSDEVIPVATKEELQTQKVTAQKERNSWQFTANNIADMTFGISDHFVWDAASVVVDGNGRRASVQAAYNDTAADFHSAVQFSQHALEWFSNNLPGVPYPFEKITVFQGYAGMEYPMMANIETYDNPQFLRFVTEHEIAHMYMPFYMGTNETRYGFMDEGWATLLELMISRENLGTSLADSLFKRFRVNYWIHDRSPDEDLPIITPGDVLGGRGLQANQYGKAALGYLAVKDLLGDKVFKQCLHTYMDRWHGKHPIPWDFFNSFSDAYGKSLNWFWNNWFFSNGYIDLGVEKVSPVTGGYQLTISNIGGMAAPVDVKVIYEDGSEETFHQTPAIWQNHPTSTIVRLPTKKKLQSLLLDGGIFMDADITNNQWKKVANM